MRFAPLLQRFSKARGMRVLPWMCVEVMPAMPDFEVGKSRESCTRDTLEELVRLKEDDVENVEVNGNEA